MSKKPDPPRPTIQPLHYSVHGLRRTPRNMTTITMPSPEMKETLTQVALDIFTDCANAGVPFQEALLAVYLSGLQQGFDHETSKKDIDPDAQS